MKQTIEIEVPDGMKAIWENGTIKYVPDEPYWKKITTFQDALHYVHNYLPDCGDLIESYKSFLDEMHEKGFDDEYILSFDDYKKFRNFQMKFFTDFLCFGNLQLETLNKWNEEKPKAKILYLDFDSYGK